jgi:hypothetical protein
MVRLAGCIISKSIMRLCISMRLHHSFLGGSQILPSADLYRPTLLRTKVKKRKFLWLLKYFPE